MNRQDFKNSILSNIPNIISIARIIFSAMLLGCTPFTAKFYIVYIICGASDIADGFLARHLNAESAFGSVLDSISDFVFIAVCFIKLWGYLHFTNTLKLLLISIAAVKIISLAFCAYKNKSFGFRHTILNKAIGFLLFASVPFITHYAFILFLCIFAFIAAIDELILNIRENIS